MTTTLSGHQLHHRLLEQLESVAQCWPDASEATVSAINAREVLVGLTELRDSLTDHFAIEEEHGLLPEGAASDPRSEARANAPLKQHAALREQLNAVIASVPVTSEKPSAWVAAKKHFEAFRKELQAHEYAEIALIQTACGDSMGTGD